MTLREGFQDDVGRVDQARLRQRHGEWGDGVMG